MSFVIESGVPLVRRENQGRGPGKFLLAIRRLEAGQSFVFEKKLEKSAANHAFREGVKGAKKFTIRSLSETTARIWRTA